MKEFDNRAAIIAKSFAYQAHDGIIVQDPYLFKQVCEGILQEKNLIYTMAYDKNWVLLYRQFRDGFEDLVNILPKNLEKFQHVSQPIQKNIIKLRSNSQTFNLRVPDK